MFSFVKARTAIEWMQKVTQINLDLLYLLKNMLDQKHFSANPSPNLNPNSNLKAQ